MIKIRKPSQRYSIQQSEEKVAEYLNENQEFWDAAFTSKAWILQNLQIGEYLSVIKRICSGVTDEQAHECLEAVKALGERKNKFDDVMNIVKQYYTNSGATSSVNTLKAEKLKESISECEKLVAIKQTAGEDTNYLKKMINNLEHQLKTLENPKVLKKPIRAYDPELNEIFEHYTKLNDQHKRSSIPVTRISPSSISQQIFLKFCDDFGFFEFPQLNSSILTSIFKKKSLYHKVMHKHQFIESLSEISKLIFSAPNLPQLHAFMCLNSAAEYRSKLKPLLKPLNLDHSMSEKSINKTMPFKAIHRNIELKEKLLTNKKPRAPPKTCCGNSRTPITWKVLNQTDLNALGEEFDVRDLIIETPQKPEDFEKPKSKALKFMWEDKRSRSEVLTHAPTGERTKPIELRGFYKRKNN